MNPATISMTMWSGASRPLLYVRLHFASQLRAARDLVADDLARRDVRNAVVLFFSRCACVPLPQPGAPNSTMFTISNPNF